MREYNAQNQLIRMGCNACGRTWEAKNGIVTADFISVDKIWGYFSKKDGIRQSFDLCEECFERLNQNWRIPAQEQEETELLGQM